VDRTLAGAASRSLRRIWTPHVRGPVSYLIALHEIAHVVAPIETPALEDEAACWRWALSMSLRPPTARTRRSIARRLLSYLARELDQAPDQIPHPEAAFRSTLWSLEPDLKRRYERHTAVLAAAGGAPSPPRSHIAPSLRVQAQHRRHGVVREEVRSKNRPRGQAASAPRH